MRILHLAGAMLAVSLLASSASAATYTATMIAGGLNNPRGLAFGPDGALYVAEAGFVQLGGPSTIVRGNELVLGSASSITRIKDGVQERIIEGLPSYGFPATNEVGGAQDIAFTADGTGYVVIGLGTDPALRFTDLAPGGENTASIFKFTGGVAKLADPGAVETALNPAGGPFDSNPFHLAALGNELLVTDSGGNSLLKMAADGTMSVVAVFPPRFMGPPVPFSDAVPTGVAIGPDGNYYVAELTGFPFVDGAARIYKVTPLGEVSIFADGFTNITDIAFRDNGDLYVLEFDDNGLATMGGTGTISLVRSNGWTKTLFSGLVAPTGLEMGADGKLYVTNFSAVAGIGQVLRIDMVPEPASWAMMIGGFGLVGIAARRKRTAAA